MAADWIKVEIDTPHKPEVLKLARILGIHKAQAFGLIVMFWGWCDKQTSDGRITGVTEDDIDILLSQPGFSKAMQEVDWMHYDQKAQEVVVPKFDIHNSQSAKKRAQASNRQAKWRSGTDAKKQRGAKTKRQLPPDWTPSQEVVAALTNEYSWQNGDADKYLSAFKDACASKGYVYADFDAAFRNCVRADWPKLRSGAPAMTRKARDRYDPTKAQM